MSSDNDLKVPGRVLALLALGLAAAVAAAAAEENPPAGAGSALVAVEEGPDEGSYTLVCRGPIEHRLVQDRSHLLVAVELMGVANAIPPESLPAPRGLVNAVAVGHDTDGATRVVFSLNRPATAEAAVSSRGLRLRLRPGPAEPAAVPQGAVMNVPPAEAGPREAPAGAPARGAGPLKPDVAPPSPGASPQDADRPGPPPATVAPPTVGVPAIGGDGPPERSDLPGVDILTPERPVGTEDLLEISVFEIPEMSRTVRVSERGSISLPLLGEIRADGLTPRELEVRLRERLEEKYVKDPQVSVFVREHASKKVSVLGAVGKPGVYEMLGPRTLLQVLSQAGGLTPEAGATLFLIRARPEGAGGTITVSVSDLLVNRDPALNQAVRPGDVISVPPDRPVYVYVDGAVKTPGRIEQLASRPLTLLQVIAKAGGATERANLRAIQVLRQGKDGTQTMLEVNLKRIRQGKEADLVLGEGDVVVVPETFF